MNTFTFYNPVKLIFGKGQLEQIKEELPTYGKKVLVVYGGGSIKKNGLYDEVMSTGGKAGRVPELWDGRAAERIVAAINTWAAGRG